MANDIIKSDLTSTYTQGRVTMAMVDESPKKALKYNQGKIRFSLLQLKALQLVSEVGEMGAVKYGAHNYRAGRPVSEWIDAAYRHTFNGFMQGEDTDRESGVSHLAHAAWNLLTALEQMIEHPELDDRIYKEKNNE